MQVWATISVFPQHLHEQRKSAEECAAEEVYKFPMGWKFKYGQSDPWQAVVETSQWCHLSLSNIISLAGWMLRTSDAASGEQTHTNRSVRILIDKPDQNQDNIRLQHGLKSPSLLLNAQVLQFSSWNKFKVYKHGLHNKSMHPKKNLDSVTLVCHLWHEQRSHLHKQTRVIRCKDPGGPVSLQ